jgi:hypothetical protein
MIIRICRSRVAQLKAKIPDGTFVNENAVEMGVHERNVEIFDDNACNGSILSLLSDRPYKNK